MRPLFTAALLAMACTGNILGAPGVAAPGAQPGQPGLPGQPSVPPSVGESGFVLPGEANLAPRLRLKSNAALYSAIQEVLGVEVKDKKALPSESIDAASGFSNNSNAHQLGEAMFLGMQKLAASVASEAADAVLLKYCTGAAATGANCAKAFLANHGKALLARDLTADETTSLMAVYSANVGALGDAESVRAMAEALLQFPSFLYRTEAGAPGSQDPNNRLSSYEVASALAAFFWDGPPDSALLEAAAAGTLSTRDQVEKQARRLAADVKARSAFSRFTTQWLDIRNIELQTRDVKTFPGFSPAVVAAMVEETSRFAQSSIFDGDGSLKTLLTGKTTHLNKTLSDFYGFGNVAGDAFTSVPLPEFKAGILTQGSFMLAHSGEEQTSPVKRGSFVRRHLLCNTIEPAPANAPTKVDPVGGGQSIRDLYNQDRRPGCETCHKLMNPIGFGFENIDAVGRTRTVYNKLPIDSSGEIFSQDLDKVKSFGAGTGLYETLSTMPEVSACFTLRMYQFALGRSAGRQDKEILDPLAAKFRASDLKVIDLMVDIATSPAFLTRKTL
jgi:Protein of unknown function (DUF1592)/Protein of unknown function (DUF1588)/Protein of unknown function (DUF1585)/Protein of unknown function (DUF1595)